MPRIGSGTVVQGMPIPTLPEKNFTLKLGTHKVSVKWDAKMMEEGVFGDFTPSSMVIRLSRGMSPEQARTTLIHECLHLIYEVSGLTAMAPKHEEETVVSAATSWIRMLYEQNPVLTATSGKVRKPRKPKAQ